MSDKLNVVDVMGFGHVTAIYLLVCGRKGSGLEAERCVSVVTFPTESTWMRSRGLRFLVEKAGHGAVPSERCVEAIVEAGGGGNLPPEIALAAVRLPQLDEAKARVWAGLAVARTGRVSVA